MLTLVTGTPGAGKTLLTVWELCRNVPGSFLEADSPVVSHGVSYEKGDRVPRHLFSNIKGLLVEHTHIAAADLESWQTWAQAGDVIVFDEVQEVWRPRGLGVKVPPEIAAIETHRHMGVDFVLVTQHPMLMDPNIRRLVNQHFHVRRITGRTAMVYEWDHCENPGQTKGAIGTRVFFHKRAMYALFKSAQLHTKPKARMPAVAFVGLAALAALGYFGPEAYQRITGRFAKAAGLESPSAVVPGSAQDRANKIADALVSPPAVAGPARVPVAPSPLPGGVGGQGQAAVLAGCVKLNTRCSCFNQFGLAFEVEAGVCESSVPKAPALQLASMPGFRDESDPMGVRP